MRASPNTFTLFPSNWIFTPEQLVAQDPRKLMNGLRSSLNRCGAAGSTGYLFAALHGEFDPVAELFHLHMHGVASDGMLGVLEQLRKRRNYRRLKEPGVKHPSRVRIGRKPLTNLPYPLTYILQSSWPSRWRGIICGKLKRGKRCRIPEPFHTMLLLWLDRWSLEDLTLMMGMSVGRDGLQLS